MMNYAEEVTKVLRDEGYDCLPNPEEPLRDTLGIDSLEMAHLVLLLEERWPALEDRIDLDDPLWSNGTVAQIAARIEQIVEAQQT